MTRIMIIRHAEKPGDADPDHGVTIDGIHDPHDLTVRGWQRAGALVRFFAPHDGAPANVSTPRAIFASDATMRSPSRRAQHTVRPLAQALGLPIRHDHADGEEDEVAAAVLAAAGPVLIAWHHGHIPRLARRIAGADLPCPDRWPDDRFDVVWTLNRENGGGWRFSQIAQRLLPQDPAEPF